jgi:hypothetical protein
MKLIDTYSFKLVLAIRWKREDGRPRAVNSVYNPNEIK